MELLSQEPQLRSRVLRLDEERRVFEKELEEIVSELGAESSSNLLDDEGFPRSDVDIVAIKTLRKRALLLKNDISAKSEELGAALEALHAVARVVTDGADGSVCELGAPPPPVPFCVVGPVEAESPASLGGLKEGDRIFAWGKLRPVEKGKPIPSLKDLGEVARECATEGGALSLRVLRESAKLFLCLKPGVWNGKGILGCTILPPA